MLKLVNDLILLNKIVERFYRGKQAKNNKVSGTSIGLSIVDSIVELYKGKLDIDSNGKDFEIKIML